MDKRKRKLVLNKSFLIVMVLLITFVFAGCNSQSTTTNEPDKTSTNEPAQTVKELTNQFESLQGFSAEFLKDNKPEYLTAEEVYEKVVVQADQNYFVVDVRATADFAKGNIEGSVNIPYATAADPKRIENLPKDKTIIVVCYSGHTANQTVALWNMLGYDAIPMLNGMGGWLTNAELGTPLLKASFNYPVVTEEPKTSTYNLPTIKEEGVFNLNDLIMKRSQAYLTSGKGPVVKPEDVMVDIENKANSFFLLDTRDVADYKKGHIEGAINIPFADVADIENLKKLPADHKIVVVGYTGNDASQVVRVLNQLGYDSYAMLRGMRVWTSDAEINGIAPIHTETAGEYPVKVLNVDLDSSGGGASCG